MKGETESSGQAYFRRMAIFLITIAIGGFSLNGLINPQLMPEPYPLLMIHVLSMVSWYVLFIVQTRLIKGGNVNRHKRYGIWSVALAITIVITGVTLTTVGYKAYKDPFIASLNFGTMINFTIAYGAGYLLRSKINWHKRAMLLAGIAIVAPAIGRIVVAFKLPEPMVMLGYLLLILSLIIHDWKYSRAHLRKSLILGGTIFFGLIGAAINGGTASWANFLVHIWG